MSQSASYVKIFDEILVIAKSYYVAGFLVGFTPELLNLLFKNHIVSIRAAATYEQAITLANDALNKHLALGASIKVESFVTDDRDKVKLYSLYSQWRELLLEDV